jgi:uncharacterized protein YutE (UPF0331/DUF86 family)
MNSIFDDLHQKISDAHVEAYRKLISKVSEENNVDEELAEYLIYKTCNLKVSVEYDDSTIDKSRNPPCIVLEAVPKSIDELINSVDDESEWEKEMERRLLERTLK